MSSKALKRKNKQNEMPTNFQSSKMKTRRTTAVYEEFTNKLVSSTPVEDEEVNRVFRRHAIDNIDRKTLQSFTNFDETS